MLVPFWHPKLVQNGSKSDPKNVHKNQKKFHRKIDQKWLQNWSPGGVQRTSFSLIGPFLGTPCRPKGPHSAQGEALGGQMEAKELQNGAKMEPKLSPKGAKWRENGAPSEPKLIKQSVKNKAVECDGDLFLGMASTRFLMDVHWISNRLY